MKLDCVYGVPKSDTVSGLRSAEHEVTGLTPSEMLFGRYDSPEIFPSFGRPSETPSSPEYMENFGVHLERYMCLPESELNWLKENE
ncbi:hypothetical protein AVEN_244290-1 [Araneus ventricosus]|uniref:Uncharacterized protein n=1 Tax=Araneus ventricosus TaxID=182803 RepID=A0A4Y2WYS5_ARAVE|nr:hypothetical protein AVEN_244290-1 [Araneus ventricosus]